MATGRERLAQNKRTIETAQTYAVPYERAPLGGGPAQEEYARTGVASTDAMGALGAAGAGAVFGPAGVLIGGLFGIVNSRRKRSELDAAIESEQMSRDNQDEMFESLNTNFGDLSRATAEVASEDIDRKQLELNSKNFVKAQEDYYNASTIEQRNGALQTMSGILAKTEEQGLLDIETRGRAIQDRDHRVYAEKLKSLETDIETTLTARSKMIGERDQVYSLLRQGMDENGQYSDVAKGALQSRILEFGGRAMSDSEFAAVGKVIAGFIPAAKGAGQGFDDLLTDGVGKLSVPELLKLYNALTDAYLNESERTINGRQKAVEAYGKEMGIPEHLIGARTEPYALTDSQQENLYWARGAATPKVVKRPTNGAEYAETSRNPDSTQREVRQSLDDLRDSLPEPKKPSYLGM